MTKIQKQFSILTVVLGFFLLEVNSHAQQAITPNITMYGDLDVGVQKYDTGSTELMRMGESGYITPKFGVKISTQDLGGGLKLNGQLETILRPNTAVVGSTTTTNNIFTREFWAGVSHPTLGEVRIGTQDPSFADGAGDTTAYQFINFTNYAINGAAIELGIDSNNTVKYLSPVINGTQLQVGYSGNSNTATTNTSNAISSGSLTFSEGPVKLGVGRSVRDGDGVAKTEFTSVGGAYNFGFASVGAAYVWGDNSATSNDIKSTSNIYSAKVPLSQNGLNAHLVYATSKDGRQASNNEGTGYTLGLTKELAPNAIFYTAYTAVKNETNSSMYMNGMTLPTTGQDPSMLMAGITLRF